MSRLGLRVDAILHLAPPVGPKARMYDVYIYIYMYPGALISLEELTSLAIILYWAALVAQLVYRANCLESRRSWVRIPPEQTFFL